jgi:hypothetical protein
VPVATIDADRLADFAFALPVRPRDALNRDNVEEAADALEFSHSVLILQPARAIDTARVG